VSVFVLPGSVSILPPSCGTQMLWMTSAEMALIRTSRPTGIRISFAVSNCGSR